MAKMKWVLLKLQFPRYVYSQKEMNIMVMKSWNEARFRCSRKINAQVSVYMFRHPFYRLDNFVAYFFQTVIRSEFFTTHVSSFSTVQYAKRRRTRRKRSRSAFYISSRHEWYVLDVFLITRTATLNDNVRFFCNCCCFIFSQCDVPIMSIVLTSISYANHCINIHNLYIITDYFRNYNNNKKEL